MPNIRRLVRESGLPTPRHVATSITLPAVIFPTTIFCPSGRSITKGESVAGNGSAVTLGVLSWLSLLANFESNRVDVVSGADVAISD